MRVTMHRIQTQHASTYSPILVMVIARTVVLELVLFSCTCNNCIPDASWHAFVADCLAEAPVTGECTEWASEKPYGTMPNWDTSLVTDMSGMSGIVVRGFRGKSTFNADITNWDTSRVTNMFAMFYSASAFNQDIRGWNTAQVNDMGYMFFEATAFQAKFTCDDAITGPPNSCELT